MVDTRVVYLEPDKIRIEEMTLPDLKPTQVLVKTHQASVCGSERYFYRGITVRPEDEARGGPETVLGDEAQRRALPRLSHGAARPRGRRHDRRDGQRRRRIRGRRQGTRG